MNTTKFNVELLPEGKFLITLTSGEKVPGRFSMYALDRFAERKGLNNYFEIIAKLTVGMKLREYAELLLVAFEDYYRLDTEQCKVLVDNEKVRWTEDMVLDLVLEKMGGLGSETAKKLFVSAVGRLTQIADEEDGEKKNTPKKTVKKPSR